MSINLNVTFSEFSSYKFHLKCRFTFIEVEYLTQYLTYRFMGFVDAEIRVQNIIVHNGLFTVSGDYCCYFGKKTIVSRLFYKHGCNVFVLPCLLDTKEVLEAHYADRILKSS
jgi:hypothetical protein